MITLDELEMFIDEFVTPVHEPCGDSCPIDFSDVDQ